MRMAPIAVLLFSVSSQPTFADERDYSFRVGVASASVDTTIGDGEPSLARQVDFDDVGLRFSIASPLNERVDLELGWMDFGSDALRFGDSNHASAAWIAVAPSFNSGPWTLAAKLGVARAVADARFAGAFAVVGDKELSTELFVGASAAYRFADRHAVQLSLERVGDVASVVGLDYAYRWRTSDPEPPPEFGIELIAGFASTDGLIDGFRFAFDPTRDVIVSHVESPKSIYALGWRVPYYSWLSFEFVYFPTSSETYSAGGLWDPPEVWTPGMPGPPPPPGPSFTATTEQEAILVAARFERTVSRELDAFISIGAFHARESVALRSDTTRLLYHREKLSHTRPWLGVGLQYRLYKSLSLMVEHGTAGDGGRSRAMLGWTF